MIVISYSAEYNEERFFCKKLAAVNPPNPAPKINMRFTSDKYQNLVMF